MEEKRGEERGAVGAGRFFRERRGCPHLIATRCWVDRSPSRFCGIRSRERDSASFSKIAWVRKE